MDTYIYLSGQLVRSSIQLSFYAPCNKKERLGLEWFALDIAKVNIIGTSKTSLYCIVMIMNELLLSHQSNNFDRTF